MRVLLALARTPPPVTWCAHVQCGRQRISMSMDAIEESDSPTAVKELLALSTGLSPASFPLLSTAPRSASRRPRWTRACARSRRRPPPGAEAKRTVDARLEVPPPEGPARPRVRAHLRRGQARARRRARRPGPPSLGRSPRQQGPERGRPAASAAARARPRRPPPPRSPSWCSSRRRSPVSPTPPPSPSRSPAAPPSRWLSPSRRSSPTPRQCPRAPPSDIARLAQSPLVNPLRNSGTPPGGLRRLPLSQIACRTISRGSRPFRRVAAACGGAARAQESHSGWSPCSLPAS